MYVSSFELNFCHKIVQSLSKIKPINVIDILERANESKINLPLKDEMKFLIKACLKREIFQFQLKLNLS